jgi:hypothetical protein
VALAPRSVQQQLRDAAESRFMACRPAAPTAAASRPHTTQYRALTDVKVMRGATGALRRRRWCYCRAQCTQVIAAAWSQPSRKIPSTNFHTTPLPLRASTAVACMLSSRERPAGTVATVSAHDVTEPLTVQLMDATGRTVVATLEVAPAAAPQLLQLPVPAGLAGSLQVHVTYTASGRAVGDYPVVRCSPTQTLGQCSTLQGNRGAGLETTAVVLAGGGGGRLVWSHD